MRKTVWIMNHYAGNMFTVGGGRHYSIAKYLKEQGYDPIVFCSNYDHFLRKNCFESEKLWYEAIEPQTKIPYIFIKTREYSDNGIQRVLNMIDFYRGILKTAKQYASEKGKPSVIYASSVHPLTLVAGIKIAKHFGVKCISEVRDLWPESIIAYSSKWNRENPLMRILYAGEKWIYKKSDFVVMTWSGGYDYILDRGWQEKIPESKVIHISNGVDLESYIRNIHDHPYKDADLCDPEHKCFVYTGSVRKVNNLGILLSAAEILQKKGETIARIIIYGDGNELETLKKEAQRMHLDNVVFEGKVKKEYIPSILSQCYATILHNSSTSLDKYGQSQNKFFEYLAAGHPILMTYSVGHSIINQYGCGIELKKQTPEAIAEVIVNLCALSKDKYDEYCNHAFSCSKMFDYKTLTNQLINVINQCIE